jgi:arylsulfatase
MAPRPNIIVILADDMGYSDVGCYGGAMSTPNIDRLAAGGVRFTRAYNTARCCPARASLLTGLHPHQAGVGWMTAADLGTPGYAGQLNRRCLTIPEALTPAGYRSYMSGKWHVTFARHMSPDSPKDSWPTRRGFDRFFGTLCGGGSYFAPKALYDGDTPARLPEGGYFTDEISSRACGFVRDHRAEHGGEPFFLYLAYTAPHWPLHARPADIARYRGRFAAGWDELRAEKFARMREMDLLDDGWRLSPRDPLVPAWDALTPAERDEFDLRMAVYAAQVESMDRGIGDLMATLDECAAAQDTLVMFLSDNGGCHEEIHRGDPDPATFGAHESFESYGRAWANYSNVPFREFKSWVHEGGIATPLIVRWPAGVAAQPGSINTSCLHITDIMPTCLELAGAKYAPDPSLNAWPLVGQSFAPTFTGLRVERGAMFWEHEGNRAIRDGDWKLVAKGIDGEWELYDMRCDRTELNDLSGEHPARVEAMAAEWERIAAASWVLPLDGRGWADRVNGSVR